jgi:hypothetical protein
MWGVGQPSCSPLVEQRQHCPELIPGGRGVVLVTLWMLAVASLLQHAVGNEGIEPLGEDVAGCSRVAVDVHEPAYTHMDLAEHQQRPTLSNDIQR